MKNYKSYISALAVLTLASCDPMHDVYEELDKDKLPVNNKIEYTLVKADYKAISESAEKLAQTDEEKALAKSILSKEAFNDTYVASEFVPALLAQKFPQLGFTSTAQVTYNVTENVSANVLKLEGLVNQPLVLADYQAVMGEGSDMDFFSPLYPADLNLPKAVAAKFADVTENGVYYTQYDYITSDPVKEVTTVSLVNEGFEEVADKSYDVPGWTNVATEGTYKWQVRTYGGRQYMQFSAFKAEGVTKGWMVSPELVIANGDNPTFSFDVQVRNNTQKHEGLQVLISENFTGNVETATWTDISSELNLPVGETGGAFVKVESNFAKYAGKTIHIAFLYTGNGTTDATATYQIDDIQLGEEKISYINPVYTKEVLVERYNGSWSVYKFGTVVSADDYVTMGAKGSFKDQATANALLPIFMGKTYAYAKEGDTRTVVYKIGSAQKVDEYVFTNGAFVLNNWIETVTEQYVQDGKQWIFDPSVVFEMTKDDYQIFVDWVQNNYPMYIDEDPKKNNNEYFFGASSYYGNFNNAVYKLKEYDSKEGALNELKDKSDEEVNKIVQERIMNGFINTFLPTKFAGATPLVGIDTYYIPNFIIYDGAASTKYSMKFKLVGKGQFEYVEGPIKK